MTAGKRKRRKRDDRPSASRDASLEPTPQDLIRFCKEVEINLGLKEIKTTENYDALIRDLYHGEKRSDRELREKLRAGRNFWTYVHRIAAEVIEEGRMPREYARDARLNFRWRRSCGLLVSQEVRDEVKRQWEAECDTGEKISVEDKDERTRTRWSRWTRFKASHQLRAALRRFGCPSELIDRLSLCAVQKLGWLDKEWVKAQNRERSKRRRPTSQNEKSA